MRVLIVEDEPSFLETLQKTLRDEGYAVDAAQDGEEGLYKAETWDYDAILLDVNLPKKDGWEVLRELRRSKSTPVLLLTARDAAQDRVRGLDGGADDYLVQPFHLEELLARLRAVIRRSAGYSHPVIAVRGVLVDTASRTVVKNGLQVPLTAREYALVEWLALRRGKVVTRTALHEHISNEDEDSLSKVLDVHVSNIRKKLGKDFITTRRGMGYIISA